MGVLVDRIHRELTDDEIEKISGCYHAWKSIAAEPAYVDEPGFCKSVKLDEITINGYVLTPGRYVGAADVEDDDEPFEEKMKRLAMFGREIAMNQTCYALASTTGTPFALYCLFRHAIDALVQTAHGSVFDTITTSTFAASKVVLPPKQTFEAFEKTVSPFFGLILSNIEESRTLAALRDALLPKLLSGELRVPAAVDSKAIRKAS